MAEEDRSSEEAVAIAADGSLLLGPRRIPVPGSVSAVAQRMLAMPRLALGVRPPPGDKEGWRRLIEQVNLGAEAATRGRRRPWSRCRPAARRGPWTTACRRIIRGRPPSTTW
jgi:hypothetical protein